MNNNNNNIENPYNSFETPLRESMKNTGWTINKEYEELILGHCPDLNRKELCVCMGFCSAVWDLNYNTSYENVVGYALQEGMSLYMQVEGRPLFSDEREVKEVIEQLKKKGIMKSSIGYTINGFKGKCSSRICPKVFYHLVSYLNMKPEIEAEAWLTVSRSFERAVEGAFGHTKPEEENMQ